MVVKDKYIEAGDCRLVDMWRMWKSYWGCSEVS
jgi:hypothetical protein